MTDTDADPPDNVIPFGREIQIAIAEQLREMYEGLLSEEFPESLSALLKQFEELTKEKF